MKKQYSTPKVEKVEFNYEENVVASGAKENQYSPKCGSWNGDLEFLNGKKCACTWSEG